MPRVKHVKLLKRRLCRHNKHRIDVIFKKMEGKLSSVSKELQIIMTQICETKNQIDKMYYS
jgi:hypothetical protein